MAAQDAYAVDDLAGYRLTDAVFDRVVEASRQIGEATRTDRRFEHAPLFTRDLVLLDDAALAAAQLDLRLRVEPALSRALAGAGISAREFTRFTIAVLGARLAQGFVEAGVLRRIPDGVTSDNVAFVVRHAGRVSQTLTELGIAP